MFDVTKVHVAEIIEDEMRERGWSIADLVNRMGWSTEEEYGIQYLTIELTLAVRDTKCYMGAETSEALGRAFGLDGQFFMNLDRQWREAQNA